MKEWQGEIGKAQAGDLGAFTVIVREFQSMAVAYAYSLLRDFGLAEDAAQESFLEAYKSIGDLHEPKAFPGWFRTIIFKHCDRFLRRKHPRMIPIEAVGEMPDRRQNPRETAEQKEFQDRVLAAILALPDDERSVTTLFYINGYSMAEVCEFLDVPVSTVKNRLHAARSKLRERMMDMVESTIKQHAPGEDFTKAFHKSVVAGKSLSEWIGEFPIIETEGLRLREMNPAEDGKEWAVIKSKKVEQAVKQLEGIRGRFYNKERVFSWAVTKKDDDRAIGFIWYWEYLYHPETPWGAFASVAANFLPEYLKTGLISEALRGAAQFGFGKVGFARVQYSCSLWEEDIMRELEAAGFQREGILRSWWYDKPSKKWQDEVMYSLVKGDFD